MTKQKIAVIAAHPDDEILGCGGTIAKHVASGASVSTLILAEGATSRSVQRDRSQHEGELSELMLAAKHANKIIGVTDLEFNDFPDNRMDSVDLLDVVKRIERFLDRVQPELVYTHFAGDINIDHRIIHEAVLTACRPVPEQIVKELRFFEVASSTEWQPGTFSNIFSPTVFVDITETLELKKQALSVYEQEMRAWPHARSIRAVEALARWRGATVGVDAAEAFVLGRKLEF